MSRQHHNTVMMRKEYDFSKAKKNPYIRKLKKQVTVRLESEVIDYFKGLSVQNGIPYQSDKPFSARMCSRKEEPHD